MGLILDEIPLGVSVLADANPLIYLFENHLTLADRYRPLSSKPRIPLPYGRASAFDYLTPVDTGCPRLDFGSILETGKNQAANEYSATML